MSKKYDKNSKHSQYDDYEEDRSYKKKVKTKTKKKEPEIGFMGEIDYQKQKANNRYLNKKKDKSKYDRDDGWY